MCSPGANPNAVSEPPNPPPPIVRTRRKHAGVFTTAAGVALLIVALADVLSHGGFRAPIDVDWAGFMPMDRPQRPTEYDPGALLAPACLLVGGLLLLIGVARFFEEL